MKKNELSMFIVTHKQFNNKFKDRIPILVGNNKDNLKFNTFVRDDDGINIAEKNANYCELTALYWIWKNCDSEFISLEHYRRIFLSNKYKFLNKIITKNEALKMLKKYDIILPTLLKTKTNNYNFYINSKKHIKSDLDKVIKIINNLYPEMNKVLNIYLKNNLSSCFNMFIGKKEIINEYCEWLFSLFSELEKQISLENRNSNQQRVYGYLSERLFNVWLKYKKVKIGYCDVLFTENKLLSKIKQYFKHIVK